MPFTSFRRSPFVLDGIQTVFLSMRPLAGYVRSSLRPIRQLPIVYSACAADFQRASGASRYYLIAPSRSMWGCSVVRLIRRRPTKRLQRTADAAR